MSKWYPQRVLNPRLRTLVLPDGVEPPIRVARHMVGGANQRFKPYAAFRERTPKSVLPTDLW